MRGWTNLYGISVGLGARYLRRRGYQREAVIRIVVPLDPCRYLELPWADGALAAGPGERVLDLASPKLLAVALARTGVEVVSVDALPEEIDRWRRLTEGEPHLRLEVGDGRSLAYEDASFDHAYSISVLEHIPDAGDEAALAELARVVRSGGRIVLTLPYAKAYWEEWRDAPVYGDHGEAGGRYLFQRWYDRARVERLLAAAPVRLVQSSVVRLQPNLNTAYNRLFPWLVPLGPFFGLLAREREDERGGDVIRLVLECA